jgi:hypothetical protein
MRGLEHYGEYTAERLISMSAGKHTFKHSDTARLIRATLAAGLKPKGVTLRDGKPYVEIDDGAKADSGKNPWDKVLPDEDTKRPA